ncbi:MAG: diaminopimelate decarboxylase [Verrucomicrobia bacterium]|nr:diaminopimelate decarboxylase [Verrucomicrobiota bacterium]
MHSFHYRNGVLHCEDADLEALAAQHGTPLYVYSAATIRDHYRRLDQALHGIDHLICYAVKANSNPAVLRLLAQEGAGFDIVSGGELHLVRAAGGEAGKCTFAGVGKTKAEIAYALEHGVHSFNVESEAELEAISEVAKETGRVAPFAVRVNPDVGAGGHKFITTGKSENKFGIGLERVEQVYADAARLGGLRPVGVQMHIGSQITEAGPFALAVERMLPLVQRLKAAYDLEFFSIGGGIGIMYQSSLASGDNEWWHRRDVGAQPALTLEGYAAAVAPLLRGLGVRILLEPGRLLVGNAGVLLTRVLYRKTTPAKRFVIVDAGMNDLIRPALYSSYHEIVPVHQRAADAMRESADVVGPVCESGDFFAQARELPVTQSGELLALMSAGAYGFVMASNYNTRPHPAEVLVSGAQAAVVRERQTMDDLTRGTHLPAWL